jgi:hypothetical protein
VGVGGAGPDGVVGNPGSGGDGGEVTTPIEVTNGVAGTDINGTIGAGGGGGGAGTISFTNGNGNTTLLGLTPTGGNGGLYGGGGGGGGSSTRANPEQTVFGSQGAPGVIYITYVTRGNMLPMFF